MEPPRIDPESGLPAVYGGMADQVFEGPEASDVFEEGVFEGNEGEDLSINFGTVFFNM